MNVFNGLIDEIRISDVARYDRDFTQKKRFVADKNILALYHFDEGTGTVLKDSSGNEHHGKIVGAKWVRVDDELKVTEPGPPISAVNDPHRRAAEMVLRRRGSVSIFTPAGKKTITKIEQLPQGRFALEHFHNGFSLPVSWRTGNRLMKPNFTDKRSIGNALASFSVIDAEPFSDADWKAFEGVTWLPNINHMNTPISVAGLNQLKQIGNFQILNLSYSELSATGLSQLVGVSDLRVGGYVNLTDATCESISKMTELRHLAISGPITATGVKRISQLPHLQHLMLSVTGLQGSVLAELRSLKSLQILELSNSGFDDDDIESVSQLSSLKVLNLLGTQMSDDGADRLQRLLPDCSVLHPSLPTAEADKTAISDTPIQNEQLHLKKCLWHKRVCFRMKPVNGYEFAETRL